MSVPDIHVCTALDQKFCHVAVPNPQCLVERRVSLVVKGIYICTAVDEQLCHVKIPIFCNDTKNTQVYNLPLHHVLPILDQKFRHVGVLKPRCLVERRVSLAVEG